MSPFIYLRALRHADHTVFCVQDGQKFYYDPQFGRKMAFSSGQQVKRSILDAVTDTLGEPRAPITFNYVLDGSKGKQELTQGEPWSPCDPTFADQLLGGWMRAHSGDLTIKRRSPLSISAMRPLHPLLSTMSNENLTFDRSENPDGNPVRVRNAQNEVLTDDAVQAFLDANSRALPRRHWIPDNSRTSGLFVYDVAVDLRKLFSVSINRHDPELTTETIDKMTADGWQPSANGLRLVAPKSRRDEIIPALANGLIEWRVTSNQARTYSPQETLAVAISDNANKLAGAIRAQLREDSERPNADPVVQPVPGAEVYATLACDGYVTGRLGTLDALDRAEAELTARLSAFDYDALSA